MECLCSNVKVAKLFASHVAEQKTIHSNTLDEERVQALDHLLQSVQKKVAIRDLEVLQLLLLQKQADDIIAATKQPNTIEEDLALQSQQSR